jgi:hypothetical protein
MAKELTKHNECYSCIHRESVAGSAHSNCDNPDPIMNGHPTGIKNGWFNYPHNFDPVWKLDMCANFENKD